MSEQEIEQMCDDLIAYFPDLPNPEREPKRFAWYVKVFKYYQKQK